MALFDAVAIPEDLVARPSGIWDTRAPFHYFIALFKREMRYYTISAMVHDRTDGDLVAARAAGKTLKDFLVEEGGKSSGRYWRDYALNQTETNLEGVIKGPIFSNARSDLLFAQQSLRRSSVISTFSLFEAYIHSWVLNYLLATLESGSQWTPAEQKIAKGLSPVHGIKTPPTVSRMISAIPLIDRSLGERDANGYAKEDSRFTSSAYTLLDSLNFWRTFRNNLVHHRGFCTPRFFERFAPYREACLPEYKRDKFSEREGLTVSPELLRKCHIVLYRCARTLEFSLESLSRGRRGHPWAPEPRPAEPSTPPKYANRLLIPGDHPLSLQWHADTAFREQFKLSTPKSA